MSRPILLKANILSSQLLDPAEISREKQTASSLTSLRLVFTSDGVVVGVVIRRVERYDLVKIKPREPEAEH